MTGDAAFTFYGPLVRDHGTAEPRRSGDRAAVPAQSREFLFLDPDIRDPRILLDGLVRPVTVIRLKRHRDPLRQIAVALAGARGIDGLHILCHGAPGALRLAGRMVDTETLRASQDLLTVIRAALSDEAAIGLYACSVCVGEVGATFVDTLSHALGARVEGASEQLGPGAGWQSFDAAFLPFDPRRLESYPHVLVNATATGADFNTKTGDNLSPDPVDGHEDNYFANDPDTLYIGNPTFISGSTIDGGGGNDTLQLYGGVDISGTTVTSFEKLLVKSGGPFPTPSAAATVSAAQHNAFTIENAGDYSGKAVEQTITLGAGTEAVTGSSVIEAYVLSENYTGTFTIGSATQKVTGNSGDNTFVLSDFSPTQLAKIDGGAGNDALVLNGTVDLVLAYQNSLITNIESYTLGDGASVTMLASEHDLIDSAPGTNTVSLIGINSSPVTAHAEVETYVLTDELGNHQVTLKVQAATNVISEDHSNTIQVGGLTVTGTYDLDTSDVLRATDGADISRVNDGAAITAAGFGIAGSVTMTVAQYNGVAANVQGETSSDTVVLSDAGTVTGSATIEAYTLADGSNDFTMGSAGQSVTGGTGADTVTVGTYEVAGTLAGGAGNDTLVMSAGANLSGATVSGFENFALSGNGSFSIPELASGQTIELTGVIELTAANVRINGSNIEVSTDETNFDTVETTFATSGDLSELGIASVTESGGNTYITLGAANSAPTIGGAAAGQAVDDTATITPFSAVTLADADGDTVSVSIQLDTAGKGAFTAASLTASGFTKTSSGVYGLAAPDAASAQVAIRQLVFDPAENRVVPGATETTTFTITVNDGTTTASSATTTVVSTSINDTPSVTSGGTASVAENTTSTVYTVTGSDPDAGANLTYEISGGADEDLFTIDADTGAVTFQDAPDFENPTDSDPDSGGDNVYDIEVTTKDGPNTSDAKAVAITVTAVNEAPSVTSDATASVAENTTGTVYTVTGSDPDAGASLTYAISGGDDANRFNIDAGTGAVTFENAPDFENPTDSGGDNVYDIEVTTNDGTNTSNAKAVAITVTAVDENPTFSSGTAVSVVENGTATGYTATATDPEGTAVIYELTGGDDANRFNIDAGTGAVTFQDAPDFENPTDSDPDSGGDNVYDIEITATDGTGKTASQAVAITVTDDNEAPSVTSGGTASVAENTTGTVYTVTGSDPDAGASLTYAISGGDDANRFNIDADTGAVTFQDAPDFENPTDSDPDSGGDNVYDIEVTASDNTNTSTVKAVTITVTDDNEAPSVTSGDTASVAENATGTVYTVTGSDPDAGANLTYEISGGADEDRFNIDTDTGAVTFKNAPDFENPADSGGNNVYDIEVTTKDGTNTSTAKAVAITVADGNEAPTIGNLDGDALTYDRSGKTNRLDTGSAATLSDDSSDFDGGNLTVSIIAGEDATDDVLAFDTTDVSLSDTTAGATVTVGGTVIGTLDNAIAAGNDLVVTFNGDANAGLVQTLLRSIAYQNLDTAGAVSGTRTIQVTVNDGSLDSTIDLTATVPNPPSGGSDTGIVVTPTTPTTTGGGSTSTSAQVISNQGSSAGSAPIVQNTNNNGNVVTATLPGGTSLTSEGPTTAQSTADALTTLIKAVEARGSASTPQLTNDAQTFLNNLSSTTTLDVRTIVPTTTTTSLTDPIVVTGTTPTDSSTQSEAFVIDMRSMPTGSTLQLDNIEFASILGSTTVTGGEGDNFVTGDENSQFISLGVGDDTLYGGDGDDTIGSADGDDRLNGDSGNDRVFGGIGHDTVDGGSGNDVLLGNDGDDVLIGGAGRDVGSFSVEYQASFGWVQRYNGVVSAEGDDRLESGVEILTFSDNRVTLTVDEKTEVVSFNEAVYLAQNQDVAHAVSEGMFFSGFEHYEQYGQAEGRLSGGDVIVDESYYLEVNSDVAAAVASGDIASGRAHFEQYGQSEGRDPTPLFDSTFYLAQNIDVAEAVSASVLNSAYEHYQLYGAQEGRAASQYFDTAKYLAAYTDVAESGMNALDHYLKYGVYESRTGFMLDDLLI